MSYVEVYNEAIYDLLTQEDQKLKLREDSFQGIVIQGATEVLIT